MVPLSDPIVAVTHPDPYPYYADLVARAPLHRDERLGLWIATGAMAVTAVLTSERCRVRPPAEPVPPALSGSPAGEVFARLVRMNDGRAHATVKPAVATTLEGLDADATMARARTAARGLAAELVPARAPERLADFALRLPVYVVAGLLGADDADLPRMAGWTAAFAGGLAPGAPADAVAGAGEAARALREAFRRRMTATVGARPDGLTALAQAGARAGLDADTVAANAVGLLFQSHEATAALIVTTVAALGGHAEARARVAADSTALRGVVSEVVRWDAPVQNTRRWVAEAGSVGGQPMKAGDAILVVLAAANRDPAVNADPDRFDASRRAPVRFTFGLGPHACPGEAMAVTIATAGVQELLAAGVEPARLGPPVAYRRSVNVRMPLWGRP